jgi:hypothetical protein
MLAAPRRACPRLRRAGRPVPYHPGRAAQLPQVGPDLVGFVLPERRGRRRRPARSSCAADHCLSPSEAPARGSDRAAVDGAASDRLRRHRGRVRGPHRGAPTQRASGDARGSRAQRHRRRLRADLRPSPERPDRPDRPRGGTRRRATGDPGRPPRWTWCTITPSPAPCSPSLTGCRPSSPRTARSTASSAATTGTSPAGCTWSRSPTRNGCARRPSGGAAPSTTPSSPPPTR